MTMHTMSASLRGRWYHEMRGETVQIPCDSIEIPSDRVIPVDQADVSMMYESIETKGLIAPIGIRRKRDEEKAQGDPMPYMLIFGATRLTAWSRKFAEALSLEKGTQEREEMLKRWHSLPVVLYDDNISPEMCNLLELTENLERKQLDKADRAKMTARVLVLMKGLGSKSANKSKSATGKKVQLALFQPPTQGDVIKSLGISKRTFLNQFKTYQADEGISVNWTKITEEQYNGFIEWQNERAEKEDQAKQSAEQKGREALNREQEKRRNTLLKAFTQAGRTLHKECGDLAVVEGLEAMGCEHLIGGDES